MTKKPFFSIIIPTYNRSTDLQLTLYCLIRQSFSDFEVIISDNCSTDNTNEVVNKIRDKRILYYKNNKNIGVTLNYRKALEYAKGKYIFLHSDDDFLLYNNSLEEIYNQIMKLNPGYIRVNYICLSPDKKRIFDFKANKSFSKDHFLPPHSQNKNVIQFILDSDATFVSGIVFKNNYPNHIKILNTQPFSWIEILFYVGKKYGGYYISKPHIIASWSKLRISKNSNNVLYSLINGRLASESYFNAIKKRLDANLYRILLHNQLMGIYIRRFQLIKLLIGNKNLLELSKRIRFLDPSFSRSITYWTSLFLALIMPKICVKVLKNVYLLAYILTSNVKNKQRIRSSLRNLKKEYAYFLGDLKPTTNS